MKFYILILIFGILLVNFVVAKDVLVFQGQYFIEAKFQVGTYDFEFNVYDDETSGNLIYSDKENITLGNWGQWKVELVGLSEAAKNVCLEDGTNCQIINDSDLDVNSSVFWNGLSSFLSGWLINNQGILEFNDVKLNSTIDERASNFGDNNSWNENYANTKYVLESNERNLDVNSSVFWNGLSNVRGILGSLIINDMGWIDNTVNNLVNYYTKSEIDLKLSQKQNTSNSISSSSINENKIPVSFISTTSGDLKKNVVYLPLGTSGQISTQVSDSSWIIDKDLVITGILWNANINSRINPSRIILMKSVTSKNLFFDTDLNVNLQGYSKGSNFNFNVSFNQGDLALIKYEPTGGANERINDISITLVGYYK